MAERETAEREKPGRESAERETAGRAPAARRTGTRRRPAPRPSPRRSGERDSTPAPATRRARRAAAPAGDPPPPPDLDRPAGPAVRRTVLALALVAVLLVAGGIWLGARWHGAQARADAQVAGLSAGRQAMVDIGTFAYPTVDADLQRILSVMTGDLKDTFQADLPGTRQQIVANQLTKRATVLAAGVSDATPTKTTVLLLIQSEGTSKAKPSLQLAKYRVELTMVLTGGRWLASEISSPVTTGGG